MTIRKPRSKSYLHHRISDLVSERHLEQLIGLPCARIDEIAEKSGRYYRPFDKRRDENTKWRHIDNPTGVLRELQDRLQIRIFSRFELPTGMHGGVKGHTLVDNARPHVRKPEVVRIDLSNCFPNIDPEQVYDALRRLGWSATMAGRMTRLTTFQHRLPQGAPTSSSLANLVLSSLFEDVSRIAEDYGLTVTFWVDDIILSGENPRRAIEKVIQAINRNGHRTSRAKIDILRNHKHSQRVTGVVVNTGLSAGRSRIQRIRNKIRELSDAERHPSKEQLRSIEGQISSVAQINARQGSVLKLLRTELLPKDGAPSGIRIQDLNRRSCNNAKKHRK